MQLLLLVHSQVGEVLAAELTIDVSRVALTVLFVLERQVLIRLEHDGA